MNKNEYQPKIYKLPHILPCMGENKQNLACCQLEPVFTTNCRTILRLHMNVVLRSTMNTNGETEN